MRESALDNPDRVLLRGVFNETGLTTTLKLNSIASCAVARRSAWCLYICTCAPYDEAVKATRQPPQMADESARRIRQTITTASATPSFYTISHKKSKFMQIADEPNRANIVCGLR